MRGVPCILLSQYFLYPESHDQALNSCPQRTIRMTPLVLCLILWPHDLVPFGVQRSHQAAGREVFDVTSEP